MEAPRVHITTYGCQMNQLDAELVAEVLRASGAEVLPDPAAADVLLFITCSVRAHAENRVFSNIGKLAPRKRRQPGLIIGLLGCMAQEYGPEVRLRAPLVDLVCAPGRLAELPALIAQARAGRVARPPLSVQASEESDLRGGSPDPPRACAIARPPGPVTALDPQRGQASRSSFESSDAALDEAELRRPLCGDAPGQAYVVAMRGCDNFCSYCVVPHVRGPERSRPPSAILEEVRRLVGQGAQQITLLGQAVNKYAAAEAGRRWDLADLLEKVARTPGLARLGFITNHPRALSERLAAVFRDVPRVIPYLHMPAQSGSDAVLARMNRGYTAGEYLDRVAMVRAARPDVSVASDFIVGFPGETVADFEATCELVRRARFSGAFVFKYSPRPNTVADRRYADDVPDPEKRRRNNELLALVDEITGEENAKLVGRTFRVFVEDLAPRPGLNKRARQGERPSRARQGERLNEVEPQLRSRTPCNRIVVFDGPAGLIGTEVDVRIETASLRTLFGTLVSESR